MRRFFGGFLGGAATALLVLATPAFAWNPGTDQGHVEMTKLLASRLALNLPGSVSVAPCEGWEGGAPADARGRLVFLSQMPDCYDGVRGELYRRAGHSGWTPDPIWLVWPFANGKFWTSYNTGLGTTEGFGQATHYLEDMGNPYHTNTLGGIKQFWDGIEYYVLDEHSNAHFNYERYVDTLLREPDVRKAVAEAPVAPKAASAYALAAGLVTLSSDKYSELHSLVTAALDGSDTLNLGQLSEQQRTDLRRISVDLLVATSSAVKRLGFYPDQSRQKDVVSEDFAGPIDATAWEQFTSGNVNGLTIGADGGRLKVAFAAHDFHPWIGYAGLKSKAKVMVVPATITFTTELDNTQNPGSPYPEHAPVVALSAEADAFPGVSFSGEAASFRNALLFWKELSGNRGIYDVVLLVKDGVAATLSVTSQAHGTPAETRWKVEIRSADDVKIYRNDEVVYSSSSFALNFTDAYLYTYQFSSAGQNRASLFDYVHVSGATKEQLALAELHAPAERILAGDPLAFDGGAAAEHADGGLTFTWSFGDGATGAGSQVTHAFSSVGAYAAEVTSRASDGREQTALFAIPVEAHDFTLGLSAGATAKPGETATVAGTLTTASSGDLATDTYDLTASGLDASWLSLPSSSVATAGQGQTANFTVKVTPPADLAIFDATSYTVTARATCTHVPATLTNAPLARQASAAITVQATPESKTRALIGDTKALSGTLSGISVASGKSGLEAKLSGNGGVETKLADALAFLQQGKTADAKTKLLAAAAQLADFISQVSAKVAAGQISAADGATLLTDAQALLSRMKTLAVTL